MNIREADLSFSFLILKSSHDRDRAFKEYWPRGSLSTTDSYNFIYALGIFPYCSFSYGQPHRLFPSGHICAQVFVLIKQNKNEILL